MSFAYTCINRGISPSENMNMICHVKFKLRQNSVGFDFGKRQNGEVVSDVTLPPWSNNDPRLFVMILRQALESAYVTKNLHRWIDLVFGFKQQGEEAVKAINVFHPSVSVCSSLEKLRDNSNASFNFLQVQFINYFSF